MRQRLAVHPDPRVAHRQLDVWPGLDLEMRPRVVRIELDVVDLDRDRPAVRHRVAGVEREVEHDLVELRRIGFDQAGRGGRAAPRDRDVLADQAPDHRHDAVDRVAQVDDLRVEHLATAEGKQLARQRRGARRRVLDPCDVALGCVVRRQLVLEQRRVARHRGQDVVEVVGDGAGHPADRLHPLGLDELRLEFLAAADVADRPGERPAPVDLELGERHLDRELLAGRPAPRELDRVP